MRLLCQYHLSAPSAVEDFHLIVRDAPYHARPDLYVTDHALQFSTAACLSLSVNTLNPFSMDPELLQLCAYNRDRD